MNLYIFEPHDWDYCGGAIGIVANTYDEAINLIVASAKWEAWKSERAMCYPYNWEPDYKRYHFAKDPSEFDERGWDKWLLTKTVELAEACSPYILFDNWNYA